ncbi:MAG TPA: alpha/beta hydrolase [Opitutaceae bacterium]|nr:alpha/beta hydrolase [Opitutaceae bacterium]
MARGFNDSLTKEERARTLEQFGRQRWTDAAKGAPAPGPRILPETLERTDSPIIEGFFGYYRTPRGFHENSPNSTGSWTATNPVSFMNFPLLTYLQEIAPRPVLIIAGEQTHSRYFSEDIYKAAAEPTELLLIPNANHVNLYDRMDKIPFDRIEAFFRKSLL